MRVDPGNALCCPINGHRAGWDGTICQNAVQWDCSAPQHFREDYCSAGEPRCFHLKAFDAREPSMEMDETGGRWIMDEDPGALEDQVLLFWGPQLAEPRGVRVGSGHNVIYGGYRVKRVVPVPLRYKTNYRVEPHPDSWFRAPNLGVRLPYFRDAGGKYIKQLQRADVMRLFDDLRERASGVPVDSWHEAGDISRLTRFHDSLGEWLESAAKKMAAHVERVGAPAAENDAPPAYSSAPRSTSSELRKLKDLKLSAAPASAPAKTSESRGTGTTAGAEGAPAQAAPGAPGAEPIGPRTAEWVRSSFGEKTLRSLRAALLSKPLVILRGDPGIGKSHLALRLLGDEERERTCIVPVSATWRGREDLLGYVNPVSGWFEATEFTRFLMAAEEAWAQGDRRPRAVIFEEFNLSQPEHWLSDLLVVTQFQDPKDRRIHLGGKGIEGRADSRSFGLSPAVTFVGTVNTDHTTRPLSPRVLDRSAVVTLTLEPRQALKTAGVELDDDQVRAIETLDRLTRSKGAAFSVRTAMSLATCLRHLDVIEVDPWGALDLVLSQELLSKVRLLARDPVDEGVLEQLNEWSQEEGRRLGGCAVLIEGWREQMARGEDVVQA